MIQTLTDFIDQLDLALDQLALRDRNYDRFAMMLIDNVAELVLHQHARDMSLENETWRPLSEPTIDAKVIASALGSQFDSKVKLARLTGLITPPTAEAILQLHTFRNSAHHRGLRHEGILHSLALFYFKNVCLLLAAYKPPFWASMGSDQISHRALKYVGNIGILDAFHGKFAGAWQRLQDVAESMDNSLMSDLYLDMLKTIEATDDTIDFLFSNDSSIATRDAVVIDAQVWTLAFSDEAKKEALKKGFSGSSFAELITWFRDNYPLQSHTDPIPGWKKRAESLRSESNPYAALKKYTSFMFQTENLRNCLDEAGRALDAHIQQQIDLARGK